jgi:multimeric flavodoxin WrbA
MKIIIIQGSSRSNGNTNKIAKLLQDELDCDLIDLHSKTIGHYDYDYNNKEDDFLPIIREIAENYDILLFATPVYWFTMSGIMKTFFDRISDCIRIEKETGRKLRGKKMAAISCGSGSEEVEGFFLPFQKSAEYLGMSYLGNIHTWIDNESPDVNVKRNIKIFAKEIKQKV